MILPTRSPDQESATINGGKGNDNIWGGSGNDTVNGGKGSDDIRGNSGFDTLLGGAGRDKIDGGDDSDDITGGAGRDVLTGGEGLDDFIYLKASDSRPGGARDFIKDFDILDTIVLTAVDADSTTAGDQAFNFVGTAAFTGTAGELRYEKGSKNTIISGDTDGDGNADFEIALKGLQDLTAFEFDL
jgi:Ca2+-binding RTX toxin-like protein